MALEVSDFQFPVLYAHSVRKDWGVGLLTGESDGKRRYLFEDGDERTLASGFFELMRRVEKPSPEQQAAYTRLRGELATRARSAGGSGETPSDYALVDQLTRFRETYPGGFADPTWGAEVRGDGAERRAPQRRVAAIKDAQERLSVKELDLLLASQHFGQIWDRVTAVARQSDLLPAAQLNHRLPSGDQQRAIAHALRELLHGNGLYKVRMDRYLAAFFATFGDFPRWELATLPSALVHPTEHVCVEPATFRKQLKSIASRRSIATKPSSAGYTSCLNLARQVANKLTELGEAPRDLLDVHDFMVFTLKPTPKTRVRMTRAKPPKHSESGVPDGD